MGLFAIGDLHFGFAVSKPMDIFGENWKNHSEKIIENWKREVKEEDKVLLPGSEMCIRDRLLTACQGGRFFFPAIMTIGGNPPAAWQDSTRRWRF